MTKKKSSLKVNEDLSDIFDVSSGRLPSSTYNNVTTTLDRSVIDALGSVIKQMSASGLRPRTISDYELHVRKFTETTGDIDIGALNANHIYDWLSSMDVSNQTKLTRLKCVKAFLSRCFDNGWIPAKFWASIRIRVDSPVKVGATERDVMLLLSFLDLGDFVELRDATALLTLYQTGIRISTLAQLRTSHVDTESQTLIIDGSLLKNHEQVHLPFDDRLARLYAVLRGQNDAVKREAGTRNDFVFITKQGEPVKYGQSNNTIAKRLNKYSREYGIANINPHALRRGFARQLLDKGANVALISKALGHSDLDVTSRYLHLDKAEVSDSLRKYLR